MPKILSVGQCGYDDSRIARVAQQAGFSLDRALGSEDAATKITGDDVALILVNRVFDADGGSGLDLVNRLRKENPQVPVMLVSDYPDAQAKAVANGALPGFGKSQLGDPQLVEKLRIATAQRDRVV